MSNESTAKSGVVFVCSNCGTILDYIVDLGSHKSLSGIPKNCGNCGREIALNRANPDLMKIRAAS